MLVALPEEFGGWRRCMCVHEIIWYFSFWISYTQISHETTTKLQTSLKISVENTIYTPN